MSLIKNYVFKKLHIWHKKCQGNVNSIIYMQNVPLYKHRKKLDISLFKHKSLKQTYFTQRGLSTQKYCHLRAEINLKLNLVIVQD